LGKIRKESKTTMKRTFALLLVALACALPAVAQDDVAQHVELGVFGEYFNHNRFDTHNFGLGGRLGFNVHPNWALEGEMSYLFARGSDETFTDPITGVPAVGRSKTRFLTGLFGPKIQTSGDNARFFAVAKAGFVNIDVSDPPVTFGSFIGEFDDLRAGNTRFSFFPGVGFEFFGGPFGVRFDVGDQMYWVDGDARHNLRVTFGPHFQF
jgi:hypothetical protein